MLPSKSRDRLFVASVLAAAVGLMPFIALAETAPSSATGTWRADCSNASTQIVIEPRRVTIASRGKEHAFSGIEVSRTWVGGARASGNKVWLLVSARPNGPYAVVIEVSPGKQASLTLDEGHPDHGREVRPLIGTKFQKCSGTKAAIGGEAASPPAAPGRLDVPITEQGGDGQAANCASSTVTGLKAGGDGFLAVRSGPGSKYRKLAELRNGETVVVFEQRSEWAGVVYRTSNVACSATKSRPVGYERQGWVHTRWLADIAG